MYVSKDNLYLRCQSLSDYFLATCLKFEFNFMLDFFQDYPSIAHLVQKLSENNIQTIFAVTEEFQAVYKVKKLL